MIEQNDLVHTLENCADKLLVQHPNSWFIYVRPRHILEQLIWKTVFNFERRFLTASAGEMARWCKKNNVPFRRYGPKDAICVITPDSDAQEALLLQRFSAPVTMTNTNLIHAIDNAVEKIDAALAAHPTEPVIVTVYPPLRDIIPGTFGLSRNSMYVAAEAARIKMLTADYKAVPIGDTWGSLVEFPSQAALDSFIAVCPDARVQSISDLKAETTAYTQQPRGFFARMFGKVQ